MVQHVKQKHVSGCLIASLAMVTNFTYDEVHRTLKNDADNKGTSFMDAIKWLYNNWFEVSAYDDPGRCLLAMAVLDKPCIVFYDTGHLLDDAVTRMIHAIVRLPDGTILDPLHDEPRSPDEITNIKMIIHIRPTRTRKILTVLKDRLTVK